MTVIIDNNFLKPQHKKLIKIMMTNTFPLFWIPHQVYPDKRPYLSHTFILHDKKTNTSTINSTVSHEVLDILKTFCFKNSISFNKCFRANLNITFPLSSKKGKFHKDHKFKHKQLIVYLNNSDGDTVLKRSGRIKFKKYRGICFDDQLHYAETPLTKRRAILIFTFI